MEHLRPENIFTDPAELALTRADIIIDEPNNLNGSAEEIRTIVELDAISKELGFNDKRYFGASSRALALPVEYDRNKQVQYRDFQEKLNFSGVLITYTIVKIGQLAVAERSVRSLCLTFYPFSLLLPSGETYMNNERMLHTPAYAVENIVEAT